MSILSPSLEDMKNAHCIMTVLRATKGVVSTIVGTDSPHISDEGHVYIGFQYAASASQDAQPYWGLLASRGSTTSFGSLMPSPADEVFAKRLQEKCGIRYGRYDPDGPDGNYLE